MLYAGRCVIRPLRKLAVLATGVLLVASCAAAQSTFVRSGSSFSFGNQAVDTTTAASEFELVFLGNNLARVGTVRIDDQVTVCTALGCPTPSAGEFALVDDKCTNQVLTVVTRCTVRVAFAPRAAGARTARLLLPIAVGDTDVTVVLTGTGVSDPSDCVFDWLERVVPSFLTPAGATFTTGGGGYLARCYAGGVCVGTNAMEQPGASTSLFLLLNGHLQRIGPLSELASTATHASPSTATCTQPRPRP